MSAIPKTKLTLKIKVSISIANASEQHKQLNKLIIKGVRYRSLY
ncbi:hypothetical protein BH20ACI4_BH20ACI4_33680 [soil metagenome]